MSTLHPISLGRLINDALLISGCESSRLKGEPSSPYPSSNKGRSDSAAIPPQSKENVPALFCRAFGEHPTLSCSALGLRQPRSVSTSTRRAHASFCNSSQQSFLGFKLKSINCTYFQQIYSHSLHNIRLENHIILTS